MREFRFVITPFCNYRCFFCHSESVSKEAALLLKPSDYGFMAQAVKENLGWDTCTITGGEPLISPIFADVTERIAGVGIKTTVVSNVSLLARPGEMLKHIDQLNVSLHTMTPDTYKEITQTNYPLHAVLGTIVIARSQLSNLKIHINYTVVKGLNDKDKDFESLLGFARSVRATAKFIDLSTTDEKIATNADDIVKQLEGIGFKVVDTTPWQFYLDRNGEIATVTKCPFNGKYTELGPRDVFVDSNGTLYTSYGISKQVNAFDDIRNRDVVGFIGKVNSLLR